MVMFMENNMDALTFTMTLQQAVAYRQILCSKRPSGRAYPGDVFYLHSLAGTLCRLNPDNGGGSNRTAHY